MGDTNTRIAVTIGTQADTAAVDRYTKSVTALQSSLKGLLTTGAAAQLGGAFTAGGIGVAALAGRISEAISGSGELAKEMAQVERRVKITGEAFQVMSRAGKAGPEEMIASLAKYRVELGKALEGDKEARKVFQDTLKLSPEQLTALPLQRQMEIVGRSIRGLGDANKEAYAAQQLFGKGYAAMLPVVQALATQGYDKLRDSYVQLGLVLPQEKEEQLLATQKKLSQATRELEIALTPTNLRLLEMKKNVAEFLAANAGPIQSGGTALAGGLLTAAVLSQLSTRLGPQLNVIGSQGAAAFSKGFGVGVQMLPGIIAERFGSQGSVWAGLGRAVATPFGAAFAVILGEFIIKELERHALERIEQRDETLAAGTSEYRSLRGQVTAATTKETAGKAFGDIALVLAQRQKEMEELAAKQKEIDDFNDSLASAGGEAAYGTRSFSTGEKDRLDALRQELPLLQALFVLAQKRGEEIAKQNAAEAAANSIKFKEEEELKKALASHDTFAEREQALQFSALKNDTARIAYLERWRAAEQKEWSEKIAATQNTALKSEYELQMRVRLADIDAKIATTRESIKHASEATAEAIQRESQEMVDYIDQLERAGILRRLDGELHRISVERAKQEADFRSTALQKWIGQQRLIASELAATESTLRDLEQRRATSYGLGVDTSADDAEIQRLKDRRDALRIEQIRAGSGPNPTSLREQMTAELVSLEDSFGTVQQNIAHGFGETINSAIGSCSTGLQKLLGDTEYWSQRLGNIAGPVMGTLTKAISDLAVKWVAQQIWMHTVGKSLAATSVAASAPIAAAESAVWATPATLATIASFGGAAAAAPAEMAGAIGASFGLALAGFAHGGPTGPGDDSQVMGVAHANEWVAPAWMVRDPYFGAQIAGLEAARQGKSGYKLGGFLGQWFDTFFPNPLHPEKGLKNLWQTTIRPPGTDRMWNSLLYGRAVLTPDMVKGQSHYAYGPPEIPASLSGGYDAALSGGGASSSAAEAARRGWSRDRQIQVISYFDLPTALRAFHESPAGQRILADAIRQTVVQTG